MSPGRRDFLRTTAAGLMAAMTAGVAGARDDAAPRFKVVAFDAFPIFDPRPVADACESLFPGQGRALADAWRVRQFDYQWLRALSGRYADFRTVTQDSLLFAARQLKLDLDEDRRDGLMQAWTNLTVWPDVPDALQTLRDAGLRLVFLSNMTPAMLTGGLQRNGLEPLFEAAISTDRIRAYKPDPRAYQLGMDTLDLSRDDILFVAFAGWDVAGAKWFGYPTFWLNRSNGPMEQLGVTADATGPDMAALVRFALSPAGARTG